MATSETSSDVDSNAESKDNEDDDCSDSNSSHVEGPELPPELLVMVMKILAAKALRGTLLEFLLANRTCYCLGLPELLKHVIIVGDTNTEARVLAAFAENGVPDVLVPSVDALPDKFRHVRSIRVTLGIRDSSFFSSSADSSGPRRSSRRTTDLQANKAKLDIVRRSASSVEDLCVSLLGAEGHDFFTFLLPRFERLKRLDVTLAGTAVPTTKIPSLPPSIELVSLRTYHYGGDLEPGRFDPLLDAIEAAPSLTEWSLGADIPPQDLVSRPNLISKLTRISKIFRETTLLSLLKLPEFKPRVLVIRKSFLSTGGPSSWKDIWTGLLNVETLEYLQIPIYQQVDSSIPLNLGLPRNLKRLAIESAGVKVDPKRLTKNGRDVTLALTTTAAGTKLRTLIAKDVGEFSVVERRVWGAVGDNVRLCGPGDGELARVGMEELWQPLDDCVLSW